MKISLKSKNDTLCIDVLDYLLQIKKRDFLKMLKVFEKGELDFEYENQSQPESTREIFIYKKFLQLLNESNEMSDDKEKNSRIKQLLKVRGKENLKKTVISKYRLDKREVENIFKVIYGKSSFESLINEETVKSSIFNLFKRKNKALPESRSYRIDKYSEMLMEIIDLYELMYVHDNISIQACRQQLLEQIQQSKLAVKIKKDDEPDWEISNELKDYVFENMPEKISDKEKAIWIYLILCQTLQFDDEKSFGKNSFEIDINLLQNLKPNSKVICYDFSRIYAKFINNMNSRDIQATIV